MSAPLQALTLLKISVVFENNFLVPVPKMMDEWKLQSDNYIFFPLHDNKQLVLIVLVSVSSLVGEGNGFIDQVNEAV